MEYWAHVSEDKSRKQTLEEHLIGTAKLAREFADAFHNGSGGYLCGLMHDIGKYSDEFQKKIRGAEIRVDHSTAGAKELAGMRAYWAAYCVGGHHAGLPDGSDGVARDDKKSSLQKRLKRQIPNYGAYRREIKAPAPIQPSFQLFDCEEIERGAFSLAFFIRMIYSCLVDADFLDTEKFMREEERAYPYAGMQALKEQLDQQISRWLSEKNRESLNFRRTEILKACIERGNGDQGIYHLTVPTGGGKTISSMAFALNHAVKHDLKRIIYVIPYNSIIEQNAQVFRNILGNDQVLEHHSNADYRDSDDDERSLKQLASENWDAPVVVTTNVQFFESLFACGSSKCRKLHNIAGSVLIFDEAQMLPVDYLKPCLRAIGELVLNYGCTAVLCTATQPSLEPFLPKQLLRGELCPEAERQYEAFRRVTLVREEDLTTAQLAEYVEQEEQVLCILNTKVMVREVFDKIEDKECVFHLSTNMYPKHRQAMLDTIKKRLKNYEKCKVIATSLVEAGVDLDFKTVYRELAGLDSVIQAAGRCNREGHRPAQDSVTHVFRFVREERRRNDYIRQNIAIAEQIIEEYDDFGSPEAVHEYFARLFHAKGEGLDRQNIVKQLNECKIASIPFRAVADEFQIIRDNTKAVMVVRTPEAKALEGQLRYGDRTRSLMREVARFCVNVYEKTYQNMLSAGMIDEIDETIAILKDDGRYSSEAGLQTEVGLGEGIFW